MILKKVIASNIIAVSKTFAMDKINPLIESGHLTLEKIKFKKH